MTWNSNEYKNKWSELEDFYKLNNKFMENKKYSFSKGLFKGIVSMALIGLPVLMQVLPSDYLNLTVGGILVMLLNYFKFRYIRLY